MVDGEVGWAQTGLYQHHWLSDDSISRRRSLRLSLSLKVAIDGLFRRSRREVCRVRVGVGVEISP